MGAILRVGVFGSDRVKFHKIFKIIKTQPGRLIESIPVVKLKQQQNEQTVSGVNPAELGEYANFFLRRSASTELYYYSFRDS